MKNILIKTTFLLLTLGVLSSCSDEFKRDYLELSNPNEPTTTNFWRNLKETQTGLNALYNTLFDPSIFNVTEEMLRCDLGYPSLNRPMPASPSPFYIHTYTSTLDDINDKWQSNYRGIFRANQVIEGLEGIKDNAGIDVIEWKSQMAQARFFRGLFHYYVYTTFNNGKIIIRDKVPATQEEFEIPVSPAADVLAFIREDLEYAYENLYKKGAYPDGDIVKVTSGAAAMVLADSYLNELNYTEAATYYQDVISNHGYSLETDLTKMFTTAGEFNKESIFEVNFTSDNINLNYQPWDGGTGTSILALYTRGNTTTTAAGPAWIAYEYKSEQMDALDTRNYYIDPFDSNSKQRKVPLRASSMMALVEDYQTLYYKVPTTDVNGPAFNGQAWGGFAWWKKHSNHDILTAENQLPNGAAYSGKNFTVIRLAEAILNLAECKIKTGDTDGAIELINQVRKRWGLVLLGKANGDTSRSYDDIDYTPTTLMVRLMKIEKPLELGGEGHASRWIDFIRWKKSDNYGFKERLAELASETYYGVNYNYVDDKGVNRTKQNFPSVVKGPAVPTVANTVVDYEYKLSKGNFNEATHTYYPIPSRETSANSSIK
jgi:starch-binding outer membrane protein, SusD/RagB family